ncbi:Phenylalanine--tRNA ligase alpha subunit [Eumeta japonica]|uniref:phenylalanine--tRNA ligase n=1 Tax=Eumeta variegata TaxID=151549 RepID=A0A4C1WP29_EUMVA|nr:Phenylalanine--tRNA ligase alpha subunit [Eumeta japonica]
MELNEKILHYVEENHKADTLKLAVEFNEDHQKIVGAMKSLEALEMIKSEPVKNTKWELTEEGREIVEHGSHEARLYYSIPDVGIAQAELMKNVPNAKIGFSKAMSAGWIVIDKSGTTTLVKKKVNAINDIVKNHLLEIKKGVFNLPDNKRNDYKKRKLLQEVVVKSFLLTKGRMYSTIIKKLETDLTTEMILTGSWKSLDFKPYNFDALGAPPECGHLHPLLKVRSEFREIFLEMGFTEMPTNNYVESSFWNFDALFQPQQHPARDAHDTFFVSDPATTNKFPMNYLEKVKQVHSKGGYGSQGYGYDWKIEEAQKNLLRTHTTAVSARMLHKLAENKDFTPHKYFSIDKVFRNETLDATHLAEFHQVEGVILDHGLGLADLISVLDTFFKRLGFQKLQFKPAYNPYTEPSMEIFAFHEGFGKWIEIGNSGVFRPEMLLPMGFPEDIHVIAWGLSLERPTMIKYGLNNIRDLVGPKVDLQMGVALKLSCIESLQWLNSDHRPVLMKLGSLIVDSLPSIKTITNWQKVSTALEEIDTPILNSIPNDIVSTDDIDNAIDALTINIRTVVESSSRTVPTKSECRKLPGDVIELIRDKNAALRRAGKYPTCENRSRARALSNVSHKAYWGLAKALKTEGAVPTPALNHLDNSVALNDRGKSCLADSIEYQCLEKPPYDLKHVRRVEEEVRHRVTHEVGKHIKGLKIRKALARKEAVVIAIPKPRKPRDLPASYRPISLLSVLASSHQNPLSVLAVSYEPPPLYHFCRRPRNVLLDPPDDLTVKIINSMRSLRLPEPPLTFQPVLSGCSADAIGRLWSRPLEHPFSIVLLCAVFLQVTFRSVGSVCVAPRSVHRAATVKLCAYVPVICSGYISHPKKSE